MTTDTATGRGDETRAVASEADQGSDAPGRFERLKASVWPDDTEGRRFSIGVGIAMAVGLAVRVAFVLVKQSKLTLTTGDAFWYHMQAKLVADGRGFLNPFLLQYQHTVGPGADHPPGFVLILSALDLMGISSPQAQRLAMCVVGTVSILVIALLARRLASPAVGIVAAALAALYPNIWINDGMLMVESVYILAVAISLLATYRYLERSSRGDLVILSLALTVAAMTRPEALVLFGVVVVPLVFTRTSRTWRERITQVAIAAVFPILAFAPWIAYNLGRFEEPVTISTGSGQTLAAGNCVHTFSGEALGYYDLKCIQSPAIEVPSGDPSQNDPEYRRIALEFMSEHRGELPKVMTARVARLWHVYAPVQSLNLDGWVEGRAGGMPSGDRSIVGAALATYFVLLPFAVAGGVILVRRRVTLWPLLVQPLLATFIAAFTFGITRYRAGAEITLVVLAATAICAAWNALSSRSTSRVVGPSDATEPTGASGPTPADAPTPDRTELQT